MAFCERGHRIVDSTGECSGVAESSPGVYVPLSGPCEIVARADIGDWADQEAAAWLEVPRRGGQSPASCPRDEWQQRRRCPHCLAELLRKVTAPTDRWRVESDAERREKNSALARLLDCELRALASLGSTRRERA